MSKPILKFEPFHLSHERIFGKRPLPHGRPMRVSTVNMFRRGGGAISEPTNIMPDETIIDVEVLSSDMKTKSKKKQSKKTKKFICPHCATKNLKIIDTFTTRCTKCGYEGMP